MTKSNTLFKLAGDELIVVGCGFIKMNTQTRKWHETSIFDQSKNTTEPLSDFSVQIELLIQAKNRLQNTHPLAFKNNQLFLYIELKHFWFESFHLYETSSR